MWNHTLKVIFLISGRYKSELICIHSAINFSRYKSEKLVEMYLVKYAAHNGTALFCVPYLLALDALMIAWSYRKLEITF